MKSSTIILTAVTMIAATTAALAADSKPKKTSVQSPESIECSKQADAKGLHGPERIKFRANCKKELKAKASTTAPTAPPASTETETPPPTKSN